MVGTMSFQAVRYLNGGGAPPPAGNHHPLNAPYGVFKARDGYLTLGATGEKRWGVFCRLLGSEEWLDDPRFNTNGDRYANRMVLQEMINEKLQARTVEEWEETLNEAGIPAGPVYAMDGALDHPQTRHRQMVVERPHPVLGTVSLLGLPVKFSKTPGGVYRIPPQLGEHSDEILRALGYEENRISELRAQGVV